MKKLLIFKLLALVVFLSSALGASAYDFSAVYNGTTFYYNITNSSTKTVEVTYQNTDYGTYSGSVSIPNTVSYNGTTYTVTGIGPSAFYLCSSLKTVTIPSNVTLISSWAFGFCAALESISIGSNVTSINYSAFYNCKSLTKVVIPDKVTTIGGEVFVNCESLQQVTLGSSVTSIGANAFDGAGYHYYGLLSITITCMSVTPPTIQSSTFPSEFYTNAYLKVVCPYAKSRYQSATYWSNFNSNNYLTLIRKYDFYKDGIYYLVTGTNTVEVTNGEGGGTNASSYSGNVSIPSIVTQSGYGGSGTFNVTAIGAGAFNETYVVMNPNGSGEAPSLRAQGDLKSVSMTSSVTTIEASAFEDCTGLTQVSIGSGVTSIGTKAFKNCTSLISVYSNRTTPPTITSSTFDNSHYSTAALYVPKSAISSYKSASYWRNFYLILPNDGTELNYALNVGTGNISFTSTGTYPWIVKGDGTRIYAQSGNAGVASTTSTMTASVSLSKAHTITFDFKAWGETSGSTNYDKCIFSIDGTTQFSYGARDNEWETFTATIPSGSHTLTWTYSKDSSVNPEGDYFAVDNVKLTEITTQPGDVNGDNQVTIADVSALIDILLGNAAETPGADVNGDNQVTIADVSALIDFLLEN